MVENFALYSQTHEELPEDQMRALAGESKFSVKKAKAGRSFVYKWPKLTVTVNAMAPDELADHLNGFCGYVESICDGHPDERIEQLQYRIQQTALVAGIVVEPERDHEAPVEGLIAAIQYGLQALLFHDSAIYDCDARLILGPDGSYDEEADILGPLAAAPPSESQVQRYERVAQELAKRKVPTLSYPLYIEDDEQVELREPEEVARRILALSVVTYVADGGDPSNAKALIEEQRWPDLTPEEQLLFEDNTPAVRHKSLWRLESQWALVWAIGKLELPWPSGFCDVPRLVEVVSGFEKQPDFCSSVKLRSKSDILDALQLTMLQHWAVRDAYLNDGEIPADFDWTNDKMQPVQACPLTGVISERHHALNWLVRYGDDDWDDVDTPT